MLSLSLLCENCVRRAKFLAEHGLSVWIEYQDHKLLWDTGQGMAIQQNAEALGIDLATADAIALSHGHYDHTRGLLKLPPREQPYPLYAHPRSWEPKYNNRGDRPTYIGAPFANSSEIQQAFNIHPVEEPTELFPGLWMTGSVPRRHAIEDTGGTFYLDKQLKLPDPIEDDQSLAIRTDEGWVVLLGCAHAGLINTLDHIQSWDPAIPIHTVAGGMHLLKASPERLEFTFDQLRRFQLKRLYPIHCTGDTPTRLLFHHFPDACRDWHVGDTLTFQSTQ